jgi:hypothetical protein
MALIFFVLIGPGLTLLMLAMAIRAFYRRRRLVRQLQRTSPDTEGGRHDDPVRR